MREDEANLAERYERCLQATALAILLLGVANALEIASERITGGWGQPLDTAATVLAFGGIIYIFITFFRMRRVRQNLEGACDIQDSYVRQVFKATCSDGFVLLFVVVMFSKGMERSLGGFSAHIYAEVLGCMALLFFGLRFFWRLRQGLPVGSED